MTMNLDLFLKHRTFVSGDPVFMDIVNSMRVYFDNPIYRISAGTGWTNPTVNGPTTFAYVQYTGGRAGTKTYVMFDQCNHTGIGTVSMSWPTVDL